MRKKTLFLDSEGHRFMATGEYRPTKPGDYYLQIHLLTGNPPQVLQSEDDSLADYWIVKEIGNLCTTYPIELKPSHFADIFPHESVLQKTEEETVAKNIMIVLTRLGDVWQPLNWSRYCQERQKDNNLSYNEKAFFDKTSPYCKSAEMAKLFSPAWENPLQEKN